MAATKIGIVRQPTPSVVSGDDFILPIVVAQNADGTTDDGNHAGDTSGGYTGSFTATWVTETGTGTPGGTFTKNPYQAQAWFYDVTVTSAAGCTGHWHITSGSLTPIDTATITITAPVTGTRLGMRWMTVYDGSSGVRVYYRNRRQHNYVAAVGYTFDYRYNIVCEDGSGNRDTTFTGPVTVTPSAGFTLASTTSTPLTRNAVMGAVDFSDLYIASGTGQCTLTYSTPGKTSLVTPAFPVVAPVEDSYQYAPGQYVKTVQPRLTVDETYPTVFAQEYTLNPGQPFAGTNFQTWQQAFDRFVSDSTGGLGNGHTRVKVSPGTYVETPTFKAKGNTTGLLCFEPLGGIPGTQGVQVSATQVQAAGVCLKSASLPTTLTTETAAHHLRMSGIELTKDYPVGTEDQNQVVTVSFQTSQPASIYDCPSYIGFNRCWIHGFANKSLRKGIQIEGQYIFVTDCCFEEIHATRSNGYGSGDENALFTVSGPGPFLIRANRNQATGECMIFGGGNPAFYDQMPRDITIQRCSTQIPVAWQTLYKHKNNIEFKTGQYILIEGCVFDGAWSGNQDGMGVKFGSGNQSAEEIYNFEGVSHLTFRNSFCRNMQGLFSLFESIVANSAPMHHLNIHDIVAVNLDDPITWCNTDGTRASASESERAMILAAAHDIAIHHITALGSPNAPRTRAVTFADASQPSVRTFLRDSILPCKGYGLLASGGSAGKASTDACLPDDGNLVNLFITGPTGGSNYAAGAVHGSGMSALGVQFPPEAYYVAANTDIGLTDPTVESWWQNADPDTICAAIVPTAGSVIKGTATDGTDLGANLTTVRSAIAGVWAGTAGGTATQLLLSTQPAGAVSGNTLTTQPSGTVADSGGSTVTSDSSTVTASWVLLTGDAVPTGTLTTTASSGAWSFSTLGLSWSSPSTGYWHFTDGSLTAVNSATMTLSVAIAQPSLVLPTVVDQWRPTQRNREGLEVVPSASPLIGTGGTTVANSGTTSVLIPVGRVKVSVLSLSLDAMTAAGSSGTVTVQAFKVSGGVSTALTNTLSIKTDVISAAGNVSWPVLASLFDGPSNGTRRIDGTKGDTLRVDVVASGTITQQPQVRVVAELAVNG